MANTRDSAVQGQDVVLQVQFYDANGEEINADDIPSVEIRDNLGNIIRTESDTDVEQMGIGLYQLTYTVPSNAEVGSWSDSWSAIIETAPYSTAFDFLITSPDTALSSSSGPAQIQIADDVVFDFDDQEIYGINVLLKFLKARLRSSAKKPVRDVNGAFIYDEYGEMELETCNVFDEEVLVSLLMSSLSEFNSTPFFTNYAFSDEIVYTLFSHIIVEGAYVFALASQSILEKGRDMTISDSGISFQPPQLGEFLSSHYGTWLSSYREKIKLIKNNIRPNVLGIGSFNSLSGGSPAIMRLKHIRSRRII